MVHVTVLIDVRGREVPLEQVSDPAVVRAFRQLADDVGRTLGRVKCPSHKQSARDVRLHVDKNGAADLRYESCCTALREAIAKALG